MEGILNSLRIPDIWQQDAVNHLLAGRDVVVNAPTGAGKTYIFELLVERGLRSQAIYTVPTRALANDKLYEWRAKGWNVGLCTGDVADKLDAPLIVATLETQKAKFLQGKGPGLLVIDEYQMLGDARRGINYELAIALAPPGTQLLLLSGSVANPEKLVNWLQSIGRDAVLVEHSQRPVPQDEIQLQALPDSAPNSVRGFWPRMIARALAEDFGPILVFAPQRREAENLAAKLSAALPLPEWLELTHEQREIAGDDLAKLLRNRIAFHHSGLNYRQRAGLIEPLAKAGQLRVIVATTGLAAGINFSMRSVLVTERDYNHSGRTFQVRSDELMQMFGRAGRRGLDDKGFVLVAPGKPRMAEARPLSLKRASTVDWPSFLAVMHEADKAGNDPVKAADELSERLFTENRLRLGLRRLPPPGKKAKAVAQPAMQRRSLPPEELAKTKSGEVFENALGEFNFREPETKKIKEMRNALGEWERLRAPTKVPLEEAMLYVNGEWRKALETPESLQGVQVGNLCRLKGKGRRRYGRQAPLATFPTEERKGRVSLVKWFHRALKDHFLKNRPDDRPPVRLCTLERLEEVYAPLLPYVTQGGRLVDLVTQGDSITARLDYGRAMVFARIDSNGSPLINPPQREVVPPAFPSFAQIAGGGGPDTAKRTPAEIWLQLGLIDDHKRPTRRGVIFSFFNHGEGLAIAAALEDATYDLYDLLFDVANLRAGHRFEHFDNTSGRLGSLCRLTYRGMTAPGYLEGGLPPGYGNGASEVIAALKETPDAAHRFLGDELRPGDIERANLEWRSILNHVAFAPDFYWDRWMEFKELARQYVLSHFGIIRLAELPALTPQQRTRFEGTMAV
ncbi:DEAD/DEAH box helicase [Cerasicoccus frondis]|uniref:DEAD/DEAH box helicase n=1 Tax=Cerasicoccus frondis TaxID=490090 RepID=UPI002852C91E|nr:DEAD/DEAH box helicase [Cerasicoccus frondis]